MRNLVLSIVFGLLNISGTGHALPLKSVTTVVSIAVMPATSALFIEKKDCGQNSYDACVKGCKVEKESTNLKRRCKKRCSRLIWEKLKLIEETHLELNTCKNRCKFAAIRGCKRYADDGTENSKMNRCIEKGQERCSEITSPFCYEIVNSNSETIPDYDLSGGVRLANCKDVNDSDNLCNLCTGNCEAKEGYNSACIAQKMGGGDCGYYCIYF